MPLHPPLYPMPPVPASRRHPGAFGVQRKHDIHTGVDLYAPHGCPVRAMCDGEVLAVEPFTGPSIDMPWWNDTKVIYIETIHHQVLAYGEIETLLSPGDMIKHGQIIGYVLTVLKEYRGRPMSMLHMEMYQGMAGSIIRSTEPFWDIWEHPNKRPKYLQDPTYYLLNIPGSVAIWNDPYRL